MAASLRSSARQVFFLTTFACVLALVTSVGYAAGSSSYSDSEYTDYQTSEYATGEYATSDYETSHYETSDYETSQYETSDYETSEYETSQYETSEYETSEYETSQYEDYSGSSVDIDVATDSTELRNAQSVERVDGASVVHQSGEGALLAAEVTEDATRAELVQKAIEEVEQAVADGNQVKSEETVKSVAKLTKLLKALAIKSAISGAKLSKSALAMAKAVLVTKGKGKGGKSKMNKAKKAVVKGAKKDAVKKDVKKGKKDIAKKGKKDVAKKAKKGVKKV